MSYLLLLNHTELCQSAKKFIDEICGSVAALWVILSSQLREQESEVVGSTHLLTSNILVEYLHPESNLLRSAHGSVAQMSHDLDEDGPVHSIRVAGLAACFQDRRLDLGMFKTDQLALFFECLQSQMVLALVHHRVIVSTHLEYLVYFQVIAFNKLVDLFLWQFLRLQQHRVAMWRLAGQLWKHGWRDLGMFIS